MDGIHNSKSTTFVCIAIPKYYSKLHFIMFILESSILEKDLDVLGLIYYCWKITVLEVTCIVKPDLHLLLHLS